MAGRRLEGHLQPAHPHRGAPGRHLGKPCPLIHRHRDHIVERISGRSCSELRVFWAEADACPGPSPQIALKIAEKIRAGERFAAYITIPLFPEGVPESGTVQEVLHWQGLTMRMMYRIVGQVRLNPGYFLYTLARSGRGKCAASQ